MTPDKAEPGQTTIVLTAARFGGSYFLDAIGRARPKDLILQDIFRSGGASLPKLSRFLERSEKDLGAMASEDPSELWRLIRSTAADTGTNVCAKVYYYHLPRDHALWSDLAGSRIIHVLRRNLFDAYLSRVRAEANSLWQTNDAQRARQTTAPVYVDPKLVQRFVTERNDQIAWARRRFAATDFHEITYEDIAAGPMTCRQTLRRIFSDIPPTKPGSRISQGRLRMKQASNADVIQNYGAVAHLDHAYY